MCSQFLATLQFNFSITYASCAEFHEETLIINCDHSNFGDFTLLFFRRQLRNVQSMKSHVTAELLFSTLENSSIVFCIKVSQVLTV